MVVAGSDGVQEDGEGQSFRKKKKSQQHRVHSVQSVIFNIGSRPKRGGGAGEKTRWLRALAALAEVRSSNSVFAEVRSSNSVLAEFRSLNLVLSIHGAAHNLL